MIINCLHLTEEDFCRLGISFTDPAYAEIFVSYTRDLLMRNIERSVLHLLRSEQRKQYSALTSFEERENWLKEHIPEFHKIVSIESEIIAWDILFSRDKLKGVIVNHDLEKEGTSIDDLEIPEHTCEFLHMYGLDTVGEIISAGDLSYLEKTYPNKARGFRSVVLEFLLARQPLLTDKFVDFKSIFNKYKDQAPELILFHLNQYIQTEAVMFLRGNHSEECYYFNTYSIDVASELLEMKGVSIKSFIKDRCSFEKAEKMWSSMDTFCVESWMDEFIDYKGDILDAMSWFFEVKNSLYIPTEYYLQYGAYSDFDDQTDEFPLIVKHILPESECFIFFPECLDLDQITSEKNPKMGEYHFHFEDGTSAIFNLKELHGDSYNGTGIIDGYMNKEDQILIVRDENRYLFFFDSLVASQLDILLQTVNHPIPHQKWDKYNKAWAAKYNAAADAYKDLRKKLAQEYAND